MSEGFIDEGEVTKTSIDDMGEVVCKLVLPGGKTIENVRLRLPPGFQGRPVDDSDGHDAAIWRDGRLVEILALVDREVTQNLPELKKGQTRIHSLEKAAAQLISLLTDEIKVGRDATRGGARKDDEVGGGIITVTSAQVTPPPTPTFTLAFSYTNAKGSTATWGPVTLVGVAPTPPVVQFNLLELIKTASTLVKVQ